MKQAVEHIFQYRLIGTEAARQPAGIAFKSQRGFLGEIKGTLDGVFKSVRCLEYLRESPDFRPRLYSGPVREFADSMEPQ